MKDRITLTSEQLRSLSSPTRYSVYNSLRQLKEGTATELGMLMGRSSKALYYHLRELLAVGLVEEVTRRKVAKTEESVYRVVAQRLETNTYESGREWAAFSKSLLRLAEREVDETNEAIKDPARLKRGINLLRANVRLSPADALQLEEMLLAAVEFAEGASRFNDGERMVITILTLPLAGFEER